MNNDPYVEIRHAMVENQIAFRDVCDVRVLKAMREVPRHLFVPSEMIGDAYADRPLPIGMGQTISQPYIVAFMAEMLELWPTNSVLEVGTGCGYHAAVLSKLCAHVITIEIIPELATMAAKNLCAAGCENVEIVVGDGALGGGDAGVQDGLHFSHVGGGELDAEVVFVGDGFGLDGEGEAGGGGGLVGILGVFEEGLAHGGGLLEPVRVVGNEGELDEVGALGAASAHDGHVFLEAGGGKDALGVVEPGECHFAVDATGGGIVALDGIDGFLGPEA